MTAAKGGNLVWQKCQGTIIHTPLKIIQKIAARHEVVDFLRGSKACGH
jgi:hypothetical protein